MKTKAEYISLLKDFMQQNAEKYGISRIGIFGSVAREEQKEKSKMIWTRQCMHENARYNPSSLF